MPVVGSLAVMVNIPAREIVNACMYGMSVMSFIQPTGLIPPFLAVVNVSQKAWMRFIFPPLVILMLACAAFLVAGPYF